MAKHAQAKKSSGPTFMALWAVRRARGVFSTPERLCLYGLVAALDETGEASPGNSGIGDATGLDVRHVRRLLDVLLARKVLVQVVAATPRTPAVYRLDLAVIEAETKNAHTTHKVTKRRRNAIDRGGQITPREGAANPPGEGVEPAPQGAANPPGGGSQPPFEDLSEDREDKEDPRGGGTAVENGARPAESEQVFSLVPAEAKRKRADRTKDTSAAPPKKKISNAERFRGYVAAFRAGYSRAVGKAVALDGIRDPGHVLVQCCKTHAKDADGGELRGDAVVAWIEAKAEEFGREVGLVQWPYHRFNDWMNGTLRPASARREIGAQPAAIPTARPAVGLELDTDEGVWP